MQRKVVEIILKMFLSILNISVIRWWAKLFAVNNMLFLWREYKVSCIVYKFQLSYCIVKILFLSYTITALGLMMLCASLPQQDRVAQIDNYKKGVFPNVMIRGCTRVRAAGNGWFCTRLRARAVWNRALPRSHYLSLGTTPVFYFVKSSTW